MVLLRRKLRFAVFWIYVNDDDAWDREQYPFAHAYVLSLGTDLFAQNLDQRVKTINHTISQNQAKDILISVFLSL